MSEFAVQTGNLDTLEQILRDDLATGEEMAGTVVPILRHLLVSNGNSLFSDDIVARVRGMLGDIARQLLDELVAADGDTERQTHDEAEIAALVDAFVASPAMLAHLHALSVETQLGERMQARLGLDCVVSPLVQALIASPDGNTAALAMNFLAAQARFGQMQRRMMLPVTELPGDLLHHTLQAMRTLAAGDAEADGRAARAEAAIRGRFDEAQTRLGLIARLVTGMGGGAIAALSVTQAGIAIFLSALAIGSGQGRDATVLATNEAQLARLALALRAAGMKPEAVAEQFLAIHPDIELPDGFDRLGADRAAAILASSRGLAGA